jgi:predicted pyridoxine 5'-phosphate oxidase superfamily flavin-nucleotide-binding protein
MKIPLIVKQAWEEREGPVVLATVDGAGQPNAIYAGSVSLYDDERIVIADNYFDKTRRNILAGSRGSVLFITRDMKAYQLKGILEYHEGGPIFEDMKKWNPPKHPGHAAAVLLIREVYQGAERIFS